MEIIINHRELAASKCIPESMKETLAVALQYCLKVAVSQDTSGARVVAQGLLSAYNGQRFRFDVSDLALLDAVLCENLLDVFRLRHLGREPHMLILNGWAVFEHLALVWGLEGQQGES